VLRGGPGHCGLVPGDGDWEREEGVFENTRLRLEIVAKFETKVVTGNHQELKK
jgi:hypothetical protein